MVAGKSRTGAHGQADAIRGISGASICPLLLGVGPSVSAPQRASDRRLPGSGCVLQDREMSAPTRSLRRPRARRFGCRYEAGQPVNAPRSLVALTCDPSALIGSGLHFPWPVAPAVLGPFCRYLGPVPSSFQVRGLLFALLAIMGLTTMGALRQRLLRARFTLQPARVVTVPPQGALAHGNRSVPV